MEQAQNYILRPLEIKDAGRMLEWMNDKDTTQHLQIGARTYSLPDTIDFIQHAVVEEHNLHRAVVDKSDNYVGTVSLKNIDQVQGEAEYAIALHPVARGTGAAFIATKEILNIAFIKLKLHRVYLNVREENQRAIRFYEKFGFLYQQSTVYNTANGPKILLWYEARNPAEKFT